MISIVVPVYNAEKTLKKLCHQIEKAMVQAEQDFEIILVNDASYDQSAALINKLALEHSCITGIHLTQNYSQQNALLCGLRHSHGDYILTIDDDLQYDPRDIVRLIKKGEEGYDVVYGVPKHKAHSRLRNAGSMLKEILFRLFMKKPKNITITSFRILNRHLVSQLVNEKSSFVYLSAITFRCTQKVACITVKHNQRLHGKSNYTYFKLIRLLFNIFINYSPINQYLKWLPVFRRPKPQYSIKEIIQ